MNARLQGFIETASTILEPSGWASRELARAYQEVERCRAMAAQPSESGVDEALKRALDAIEDADVELGSTRDSDTHPKDGDASAPLVSGAGPKDIAHD